MLDYFLISDKYQAGHYCSKDIKGKEERYLAGIYNMLKAPVLREKIFCRYNGRETLPPEELEKNEHSRIILKRCNGLFKDLIYGHKNIGLSSIFITFQLMLIMGFKEIHLVGCDAGVNNPFRTGARGAKTLRKQWEDLAAFTKVYFPDVKVYSVNPVHLEGLFEPSQYNAHVLDVEDDAYFKMSKVF